MRSLLVVLAVAAPAAALAQPAPPPPSKTPVLDGLRDEGLIAGLEGYVMVRSPDALVCGGFRASVVPPKARPAKADAKLVELLLLRFPRNLDFTSPASRDASLRAFNAWVERLTKLSGQAIDAYEPKKGASDEVRFAAHARRAQVQMRAASLLARAEIPVDVRTGDLANEKIEAYCDKMAEVAEPLYERARASLQACAAGAAGYPSAWWSAYCVPIP